MSCETEKTGQGDPLCLSLVHQHLLSRCPSLAAEFTSKYSPPKVDASVEQVLANWEETQLIRSLVLQHLGRVAPSLAVEFRQMYTCPEKVPQLLSLLVTEVTRRCEAGNVTNLNGYGVGKESVSQVQESTNRKLGANPKTFTEAEERRITRAIEENESIVKVAKEMGRTYRSILAKVWRRKQAMTTVSKGRFSAEEDSRTRLAVENGEDYRKVTHKFELSWEVVLISFFRWRLSLEGM